MAKKGPVIIIDDDIDDHDMFQYVLERIDPGNEVKFFLNGEEVLHYLQTTTDKPLLILSDLNMPRMGGMELRKIINEHEYLRRKSIPFIFFTTSASPQEVTEAYEICVHGFFQKPDNIDKLQSMLKRIIDYWKDCLHPNIY